MGQKQNLTVRLDLETLERARVIAVRRQMSVNRLVAATIEQYVAEESRYEKARKQARDLLAQGFALGGRIAVQRNEWHER